MCFLFDLSKISIKNKETLSDSRIYIHFKFTKIWKWVSIAHSLTHPLTHLLTHPLTHSLKQGTESVHSSQLQKAFCPALQLWSGKLICKQIKFLSFCNFF